MNESEAEICHIIIHHSERTIERVLRLRTGKVVSWETVGGPYPTGDFGQIAIHFRRHYAELSHKNGWQLRVEEVDGL